MTLEGACTVIRASNVNVACNDMICENANGYVLGACEAGKSNNMKPGRLRSRRRPCNLSKYHAHNIVVILCLLSVNLASFLSVHLNPFQRFHIITGVKAEADVDDQIISDYIPININDGPTNLQEGQRLFQLGRYDDASHHLWRAVVLHTQDENAKLYKVDEAFTPFLKCYLLQDKIVDGLVFIAAESYLRGQNQMGELYMGQALERDAHHVGAMELKQVVLGEGEGFGDVSSSMKGRDSTMNQLKKAERIQMLKGIRDGVDASNPKNQEKATQTKSDNGDFWDQFVSNDSNKASNSASSTINNAMENKTPEEIYNIGTHHFNTKNLPLAEKLFELSCAKSNNKLSVACTNAVYLRTNLCDWGYKGEGFVKDMKIIEQVTRAEMNMYRSIESSNNVNDEMKRFAGIGYHGYDDNKGLIHWQRSTSIHPHMMLGYPLHNDNVVLKRYAAESMAALDELRARVEEDGGSIKDRPKDLPYNVNDMHEKFAKRYQGQQHQQPIKLGFVACSFNSKAVLYLSHDMFRFFDPDIVEVHVFSTGPPDNPRFINEVMRGVDWRQRVIDAVDYFHDVQEYQQDHIGLARYIHEKEIQILIEWDGYARQGERAAGLMALRPAPIQILHQEFLMTSGAQYFDYIVTDKVVSPMELEGLYTEKFLYLPNHFFSKGHRVQKEVIPPQLEYKPREKDAKFQIGVGSPQENACLSSNPLGSKHNGDGIEKEVSFVYCNFNKFLKNNPETMMSWLRILDEIPDSILCLLQNPREGVANIRQFVTEVGTSNDKATVDGKGGSDLNNRIHFISWEQNPFDHQQRSHSLCNAMLDSHPYNGHTTAQDSLYAGVPIVTRSDGNDMSSRVSTSANVVLGLDELNANSGSKEYEDIAIRLGNDKAWFTSIRTKLVEACLQKDPMHPYWDVPRYVQNFQSGLEIAWNRFLNGKQMDHIEAVEDVDENLRGTTEAELQRKEKKREDMKLNRSLNDEL